MKQETNLGTKQCHFILGNQHIKCLSQSKRQWILCFFKLFAIKQDFLEVRYTLSLGTKPYLQTTIPKWVFAWVWISDRWGLGVMARVRPGAAGSKIKSRPGQEEEAEKRKLYCWPNMRVMSTRNLKALPYLPLCFSSSLILVLQNY